MLGNMLRLALQAIRRNVLRSSLTVLGIVIGVAAVISMVTIGAGATEKVRSEKSRTSSESAPRAGRHERRMASCASAASPRNCARTAVK